MKELKESNRGSPKEHFYKLFENRLDSFGGEDFLSFHYSHIRQNKVKELTDARMTIRHDISSHPVEQLFLGQVQMWVIFGKQIRSTVKPKIHLMNKTQFNIQSSCNLVRLFAKLFLGQFRNWVTWGKILGHWNKSNENFVYGLESHDI